VPLCLQRCYLPALSSLANFFLVVSTTMVNQRENFGKLGNKLGSRFERTGKMEDLEESIRITQEAVNITPEDHPDLAGRSFQIGSQACCPCVPGYGKDTLNLASSHSATTNRSSNLVSFDQITCPRLLDCALGDIHAEPPQTCIYTASALNPRFRVYFRSSSKS